MQSALINRDSTLSDPARFAQAIRDLAYDAHRTLKHSPSPAALRGLARRIEAASTSHPRGSPREPGRDLAVQPRARGAVGRRSPSQGHTVPCAFAGSQATRGGPLTCFPPDVGNGRAGRRSHPLVRSSPDRCGTVVRGDSRSLHADLAVGVPPQTAAWIPTCRTDRESRLQDRALFGQLTRRG